MLFILPILISLMSTAAIEAFSNLPPFITALTSTSLGSSAFDPKYYIPAEQTAQSGISPSQSRITLSRFVSHCLLLRAKVAIM
mmetsp:Transcript_66790/g.74827  ORF Transcript_66790/g.74827 Transcript_66790/m.74827 type:complete len:83 (-) Transcript_66790:1490-1738(-)